MNNQELIQQYIANCNAKNVALAYIIGGSGSLWSGIGYQYPNPSMATDECFIIIDENKLVGFTSHGSICEWLPSNTFQGFEILHTVIENLEMNINAISCLKVSQNCQ